MMRWQAKTGQSLSDQKRSLSAALANVRSRRKLPFGLIKEIIAECRILIMLGLDAAPENRHYGLSRFLACHA